MLTTSGRATPFPSYSVEVSVPLLATHHGEVGLDTRPQAFTRCESVNLAFPASSETRFVCR